VKQADVVCNTRHGFDLSLKHWDGNKKTEAADECDRLGELNLSKLS